MSKKTGIIEKCETCGKEYYAPGWSIKKGFSRFCSLNCRRHNKETKLKMSLLKIGKPTWNKGLNKLIDKRIDYDRPTSFKSQGKCKLQEIIRHNFRYRKWRSDVYVRDDFTCQICGKRGGKIEADHNKPFSIIIEENNIKTLEQALECKELWDTNNGRTLCLECHKKTDTYLLGTKYKKFGIANTAFAVPA